MVRLFIIALMFLSLAAEAQNVSRQAAREFNKKLGRGINFMASKINGGYHDPFDFNLIRENKFTHVRIGSRVWQYVGNPPNYTIDPEKLDSYKNAVDWALDHDLMVVMDPIHAWTEYTDEDLPSLISIWEQIAEMFEGYPLDRVAFEIFNEPWSYDFDLKAMLDGCIGAIRTLPGNAARIVIVSGQSFSTRQALIDAFNNNVVFPTDDPYLIGTFHYYDPRPFTNQGDSNLTWAAGGDADPEWMETIDKFQEVVDANNLWAAVNNTEPLPIYNGEYGVDNGAPAEDRVRWLWWVRMVSEQMGFSNALWTLYNKSPDAKGLGPWEYIQKIDPTTRYLDQPVLVPYRNRYEVEKGMLNGSLTIAHWQGSSDDTLVSCYQAGSGDNVILDNIYIAKGGIYDATLRYLNNGSDAVILCIGSGAANQQADSVKLKLLPTGNEWTTATVPLEFMTGTDNQVLLRLESQASDLHLDYLVVTQGIFYDNLYPSKASEIIYAGISGQLKANLEVVPVPAHDTVFIRGEFNQWELYSRTGRKIRSGSQAAVPVCDLDHGLYVLRVDGSPFKIIVH